MARPCEFDRQEVLDKAMALFWRQGYESTSVQDLVDATGINRASMYNAFGDKHGLFVCAVDRYLETVTSKRVVLLETSGSPKAAIEAYFQDLLKFSLGPGRRLGCLLTNSVVERAPRDSELDRKFATTLERMEKRFLGLLGRGQELGEISNRQDAAALAHCLLGSLTGLRVLARGGADEATLRDLVDTSLSVLEPETR